MSFEKHSNFNKLANFSEVKFGENKPVLEVELNEMQQIQNEARADIIRDTMPSGFVTLGDIDYDYCANNDNQIKLKTESIAYVNGYRITIPKGTIIEIGEADKVREDLVFLEVWKEAVNDIDTLTEYGGENNAVINNPIKDARYPVATSQRVALKYRIRHVSDVDFTTNYDGLEYQAYSNGTNKPSKAKPQGGNATPLTSESYNLNFFRGHLIPPKNVEVLNRKQFTGDLGLYVAGVGDSSKKPLKTMDGYVYAIPMFRLVRKPNVGLCTPFEYKKIHNQLDLKKFAHLVGQENVEKVHSVNVKGKTYNNLVKVANSTRINQNTEVNISLEPYTKYIAFGDFSHSDNPNTFALLCISTVYAPNGRLYGSGDDLFMDTVSGGLGKEIRADKTLNYLIFDSESYNYCHVRSGDGAGGMFSDLMLFKYEDEMEELTLEYFKGVQSLGESTNNSITVENNLVEEGTYVHELQNHILPTHPEVTHVTWGEDVVIPPEVEIELKNGEEVIQTITQLPARLETTGEEKLHVKTMKGRTLVNLATRPLKTVTATNSWQPLSPISLVSGKKYLAIFHVESNTLNSTIKDVFKSDDDRDTVWGIDIVPAGKVGTFKRTFVAPFDTKNYSIYSDSSSQGSATVKCVLLEYQEGMENWGLKYFEGMKPVEMASVKTTGKNLFDGEFELDKYLQKDGTLAASADLATTKNYIRVKPNTTYTQNIRMNSTIVYVVFYDKNKNIISAEKGTDLTSTYYSATYTTPNNCYYIKTCYNYSSVGNHLFQIEEGSAATPYEPYKTNILTANEDVTLRGIGDVQDELNLLTGEVTERIGEIVLDGSDDENWVFWDSKTTNVTGFYLSNQLSNTLGISYLPLCNLLPSITTAITEFDYENIYVSNSNKINLNISNSKATTVEELKTYLKTNPLIVQYQFKENVVKKIGLSEDDYVGKSKVTYQLAEPLRKVGTYSDFIKGKTLYSNIGVEVLNGSENIAQRGETIENTLLFVTHLTDLGIKSNLIYSDKFDGTDISWNEVITSDKEFIRLYTNDKNALYIRILKSKLATQDVNGFKKWLQANPVTIYYVKANPVEIPLKEVSPLDVDFSLNRQFKRGYENYLKELPNGVKDVVENGKVKRNVKHLVVNGTENWTTLSTDGDTVRAFMMLSGAKPLAPTFNSYDFTHGTAQTDMNILGVDQNGNLVIGILKTLLTSPDVQGIKEYLSRKNLHVIYELQTPTTEELTEENKRYVPYMPLNSYVGSLYVADGINQTKFLTDFSPSEYEVQTYHHYFSNEFNMFEDIKRKKSPYGHKTYLEEVDGKYVEKFIAGLEKHEIEDLRHKVSLTGFDYSQLLQDSFLKLIKGELS